MPRVLRFLVLLLASTPLFPQDQCVKLTHEVLATYGGLESLKNYPRELQAQLSAQVARDPSMNDAQKARFTDAIMKNISADRLIKNVETSISTGCDLRQMAAVLGKVKTPLVQKMKALESVPNTPQGATSIREYRESPAAKKQTDRRTKLIDDLALATDAINALTSTIVATSRGMMEGMGAPAPTADQVIEMRTQVQEQADAQMKASMFAIYRNATDVELEQYVSIEQTPEFLNFNQAFGKAIAKGMGIEAHEIGAVLKRLLDQMTEETKKAEQSSTPAAQAAPVPK